MTMRSVALTALDRHRAGALDLAVDVHGARAALRDAAAVFRAGEADLLANDPQERGVGLHRHLMDLAVDVVLKSGSRCAESTCRIVRPITHLHRMPDDDPHLERLAARDRRRHLSVRRASGQPMQPAMARSPRRPRRRGRRRSSSPPPRRAGRRPAARIDSTRSTGAGNSNTAISGTGSLPKNGSP